jgi:hypothetical protein
MPVLYVEDWRHPFGDVIRQCYFLMWVQVLLVRWNMRLLDY